MWYKIKNEDDVISPSLLVYPDRIEKNIQKMIAIAADVNKLRPHVKTYKIAEIIELQLKYGIRKFKCATIAEAELLANCNVKDVLLAIQPVAKNIHRFFELLLKYPNVQFSTIVDNKETIQTFSSIAKEKNVHVHLWLDINNGMNRTGMPAGESAVELYQLINNSHNLVARGLHAYDGHIRDTDVNVRKSRCDDAFSEVANLKKKIESMGMKVPVIVAGGTPSFPIHVKRKDVEVSPGTTLLWDEGYSQLFPDMKFLHAAVLVSRIISKPKEDYLCLDLGHKSVASEMSFPRVKLLNMDNTQQISHSEEHLVLSSTDADRYKIGQLVYAIPMHICPTVPKYKEVQIVENNLITNTWQIKARDKKITI